MCLFWPEGLSLVREFERADGTSKVEVAPAYCHETEQTGRAFRPSLPTVRYSSCLILGIKPLKKHASVNRHKISFRRPAASAERSVTWQVFDH